MQHNQSSSKEKHKGICRYDTIFSNGIIGIWTDIEVEEALLQQKNESNQKGKSKQKRQEEIYCWNERSYQESRR